MLHNQWWDDLFASIDAKCAGEFVRFLTADASFRYGSAAAVHGRSAIEEYVTAVFESFCDCTHVVEQRWEPHHCRICRGTVTYTMLDQRRISLPFCNVMMLRGELIERYEIFIDPTPLRA